MTVLQWMAPPAGIPAEDWTVKSREALARWVPGGTRSTAAFGLAEKQRPWAETVIKRQTAAVKEKEGMPSFMRTRRRPTLGKPQFSLQTLLNIATDDRRNRLSKAIQTDLK